MMSTDIERKISELMTWQTKRWPSMNAKLYLNLKPFSGGPYSDWDRECVLHEEITNHIEAMNELSRQLRGFKREQLLIAIAALKQRIEYASGQSDNHTIFYALTAFCFTVLDRLPLPFMPIKFTEIKSVIVLSIAVGVAFFLYCTRLETRRRITQYKKLVIVLEFYEKLHFKDA